MDRVLRWKSELTDGATGVALIWLAIVCGALAVMGGAFSIWDLVASYDSWGNKVSIYITIRNVALLGLFVTGLPTLIQMAYLSAKIAGAEIAENEGFRKFFWGCFLFDTMMDTIEMASGGHPISIVGALFISIFLFGFAAEFLTIFMGSITISLLWSIFNDPPDISLQSGGRSRRPNQPKGGQQQSRGSQQKGRPPQQQRNQQKGGRQR